MNMPLGRLDTRPVVSKNDDGPMDIEDIEDMELENRAAWATLVPGEIEKREPFRLG